MKGTKGDSKHEKDPFISSFQSKTVPIPDSDRRFLRILQANVRGASASTPLRPSPESLPKGISRVGRAQYEQRYEKSQGSGLRLRSILDRARNAKRPWDVIALQDAPAITPWTRANGYHVWYKAYGPCENRERPPEQARVTFYVHESFPDREWKVVCDNPCLATLSLTTDHGTVHIHNFYNEFVPATGRPRYTSRKDFEDLLAPIKAMGGSRVLLGDFNLHHSWWGGDDMRGPTDGEHLAEVLREMGFELATVPGTVTYTRYADPNPESARACQSTIDLTFISSELRHLLGDWRTIKNMLDFVSDHKPVEFSLAIEPVREEPHRFLLHLTDIDKLREFVRRRLVDLGRPDLSDERAIEDYADRLLQIFRAALVEEENIVPRASKPCPKANPAMTPCVKEARNEERSMCREWQKTGREEYHEAMKEAKRKKDKLLETEKRKLWRSFLEKPENDRQLYRLARIGRQLGKPIQLRHMPPIVETDPEQPEQSTTHVEEADKANCMRRNILQGTSDEPTEPSPLPDLSQPRVQHECSQEVSDQDILDIIKDSKTRRAHGWDEVVNELFKMTLGIIEPYIAHLFRACLLLSHAPEKFKRADTVMIPKDGKDDYGVPKSWRPIALLSHLGKMLERLIARRLAEMIVEHKLVPLNQFAFAGRSTTMAVQAILNPVYKAFCDHSTRSKPLRATMLSLDITGAYDHVRAEKLLSVLVAKGIPDWLIRFLHSYLTNRVATLAIPAYRTDPFFVNIGIPQGSALSPVLFMLFAAPLLETLNDEHRFVFASGYADDLYLVVYSNSYERNCVLLTRAHDKLATLAHDYNIKFSPEKYAIMHFLPPGATNPRRQGDPAWKEPEANESTNRSAANQSTANQSTTNQSTTNQSTINQFFTTIQSTTNEPTTDADMEGEPVTTAHDIDQDPTLTEHEVIEEPSPAIKKTKRGRKSPRKKKKKLPRLSPDENQENEDYPPSLCIPNIPGLKPSSILSEMRVLGVWFDQRLSWSIHVDHVRSRPSLSLLNSSSLPPLSTANSCFRSRKRF